MNKSLVFLLTIMVTLSLQAGWIKAYGGEHGGSGAVVKPTQDGGYIVFGTNCEDIWLLRTNAQGDILWTKIYGADNELDEWSEFGVITSDRGYAILGNTDSSKPDEMKAWLLKTDETGDTTWTKTYGGPGENWSRCFKETEDEGFIILGSRTESDSTFLWLIKTDDSGNEEWEKSYGGVSESIDYSGYHICETPDGGYIISCLVTPTNGFPFSVMKTDNTGDSVWTWREFTQLYCIEPTTDGGYIATGTVSVGMNLDLHIVKLDGNGNLLWEKTYGDPEDIDVGYCIHQTSDGGYILSGLYDYVTGREGNAWLLKLDNKGDTIWSKTYGKISMCDVSYWHESTEDNGYIMTGYTRTWSSHLPCDLLLIKTDSTGNIYAVEENPISHLDFEFLSPVGREIALRFEDRPDGFAAEVFDASGRKIDEIRSLSSSGTVSWGQDHTPGVYFIREILGKSLPAQKVILVK